jgi:endonuclease/exonuclease/phosphatase family metal-dependent hydrolase
MRIATFNVENLFSRPVAMNYEDWDTGQKVLNDFNELNRLLRLQDYTQDKPKIEKLIDKYKLMDRKADHRELILTEVRGKLWEQHQNGTRTWIANGSDDFLGWVDLVRQEIDDRAIQNTARVLAEVSADIQVLVEVENRVVLQQFHDHILVPELQNQNKAPYKHLLLFDGNDPRGIDVALMSRLPVLNMTTHVELLNANNHPLFPRDCAQFMIEMPDKKPLTLFANHFSSQGSDFKGKRRKEQAKKVSTFVDEALQISPYVVVAGDLNEPPAKGNLSDLLNHQELKDVMSMNQYPDKNIYPGTYHSGSASTKLDYLFLSTALQNKVQNVNVERRGYKSRKWDPFDTVTDVRSMASDHHCVWVDINI